jgi:hypothetical protein
MPWWELVEFMSESIRGVEEAQLKFRLLIDQMDYGDYSRSQWSRLYKMYKRWERRAGGEDARYLAVGNKPGKLCKEEYELQETYRCQIEINQVLREEKRKAFSEKKISSSPRRTRRDIR